MSHLSKIFVSQEDKTVVNSTSVKMSEASTSKDQEDQDKNIVNATEKSGMDGVNMSNLQIFNNCCYLLCPLPHPIGYNILTNNP